MSPDPFIQAPTNTQSFNRYSYVMNNPLSYIDPTGFVIEEIVVTAPRIPSVGFSGIGFLGSIFSSLGSALPGLSLLTFSPAVGGCDASGVCADMLYPIDENGLIVLNETAGSTGEKTETEQQGEAEGSKTKTIEEIEQELADQLGVVPKSDRQAEQLDNRQKDIDQYNSDERNVNSDSTNSDASKFSKIFKGVKEIIKIIGDIY